MRTYCEDYYMSDSLVRPINIQKFNNCTSGIVILLILFVLFSNGSQWLGNVTDTLKSGCITSENTGVLGIPTNGADQEKNKGTKNTILLRS